MKHQPVMLLILDGWGLRDDPQANAITAAHPAFYENLLKTYPWVKIDPSGEAVGLPKGQMGNSEVGHMNIGAGRIVYQELTRIDKAIEDGSFYKNEVLLQAMTHGSTLHLMGLVSDGGVHSSIQHLLALIHMAHNLGVKNLRVHAFLDGRDVPPKSALGYLETVEALLLELDYPQIASLSGRYYAMDRDNRWDRIEKAYDMLISGEGPRFPFSKNALQMSYNQGVDDEFVIPAVCDLTYEGMSEGDSIIFFNFRPDRARQLTRAFIDPAFEGFQRKKTLNFDGSSRFTCMTMYDQSLNVPIAYPKQALTHGLAQILSENGIHQFHTAETEKYAHVTYFFNGGAETPYPGEDRQLVPSPHVATYDLQPEMNLPALTDVIVKALETNQYQFIVTNFANPDMVGHTGKMDAAVKAVEAVDVGLKTCISKAIELGWTILLTADHGNIELMANPDGSPVTSHTTALVPLVLIPQDKSESLDTQKTYALCNIAPTILDIMNLPKPPEMTADSILVRQQSAVLN